MENRVHVLTSKGQYDMINGDSDAAIRKCLDFHAIWKKRKFYHLKDGVEVYTSKMAIPTSNVEKEIVVIITY